HDDVVVQAEGQQHRLLQPLVRAPHAVLAARGDARLAGIQQGQGGVDGVAHLAARGGRDLGAGFPGGLDDGFQVGQVGHCGSPSSMAVVRKGPREAARCWMWSPSAVKALVPTSTVVMPRSRAGSRFLGVSSKKQAVAGSTPKRVSILWKVRGSGLGIRSASSSANTPSKKGVSTSFSVTLLAGPAEPLVKIRRGPFNRASAACRPGSGASTSSGTSWTSARK